MTEAWRVSLNGVGLEGGYTGTDPVSGWAPAGLVGCLTEPPIGLGNPDLRTEDVTYPQRDGVVHFSDWYGPRILTFQNVTVCPDGCPTCPSARERARVLLGAWSRHCDDTELVIFTDCHDSDSSVTGGARAAIGPYGVAGRPRVATIEWQRGKSKCGTALLRFDGTDQRLFILDPDGAPGSGVQCVTLTPAVNSKCREYPRCYDMCYTVDNSIPGSGPQDADNFGDLCAPLTITLTGTLTTPEITNDTTGESFTYGGVIADGATVVIDTQAGTAFEGTASRTNLLTGSSSMQLVPGVNSIRLTSQGPSDTGSAEICFRPAVLTG